MHRSGTSAFTRVLNLLGASLGDEDRLMQAQPDNPRGFWEVQDFSRFNDRLLQALGGSWDSPPRTWTGWSSGHALAAWRMEAAELLEQLREDGKPVHAVKDPRFSLTLPLWLGVEPDADVVVPMRDPLAVAESLQRRNRMTLADGAALWTTYVRGVLDTAPNPLFVSYADLILKPEETTEQLARTLDLDVEAVPTAAASVSADLDHGHPLEDVPDEIAEARELYDALLSGTSPAAADEARDRVVVTDPTAGTTAAAGAPSRTVLLHYHLFKNAGTSLDALLQEQFPGAWVTREFPVDPQQNARGVADWILSEPDAVCFSSHTALLPPPVIQGVEVIPIIFVRHPLDRIASAYSFERKQRDDRFGATLARNTTLGGYIDVRLSMPHDRQCRNFHTERFSGLFTNHAVPEVDRAVKAVECLPFVGVVEEFSKSLAALERILDENGIPGIRLEAVRHNASKGRDQTLSDRLVRLADDLGEASYRKLLEANTDDLAVYHAALARLKA